MAMHSTVVTVTTPLLPNTQDLHFTREQSRHRESKQSLKGTRPSDRFRPGNLASESVCALSSSPFCSVPEEAVTNRKAWMQVLRAQKWTFGICGLLSWCGQGESTCADVLATTVRESGPHTRWEVLAFHSSGWSCLHAEVSGQGSVRYLTCSGHPLHLPHPLRGSYLPCSRVCCHEGQSHFDTDTRSCRTCSRSLAGSHRCPWSTRPCL